jgi:hypothetical protein
MGELKTAFYPLPPKHLVFQQEPSEELFSCYRVDSTQTDRLENKKVDQKRYS